MDRLYSRSRHYLAEIVAAIRADALVYIAATAYFVVGASYVLGKSGPLFGDFDVYASACIAVCCIVLPYSMLLVGIIHITFRLSRRRRLAYRQMFRPTRVARFVAGTLLMLLVLLLFEEMFTCVKSAFSSDGFAYDRLAADADGFIHFGYVPTRMLAFLRQDWLLRIVEFNYDEVWVAIWFGLLYWVAVSPRADSIRLRFCLTFMLVWIIGGNVIAGMFPTAGPALYGLATGDTGRFANLHSFLGATPNATAATQNYLWALYQSGRSGFGSGISAFPSMHVAIITMCALFLGERGRWLRIAGILYTLLIMASSVYLGWHYAIDGYAAVVLTAGIYWTVRSIMPHLAGLNDALAGLGQPARTGIADIEAIETP